MVLLRRLLGDSLRARRQAQHRTLREVSTAANVSLGYLSEIERGQKEASSELLAAICGALGLRISDVMRDVSHSAVVEERTEGMLRPVRVLPEFQTVPVSLPAQAPAAADTAATVVDGEVSVTVRHDSPLRTTLMARRLGRGREVAKAA